MLKSEFLTADSIGTIIFNFSLKINLTAKTGSSSLGTFPASVRLRAKFLLLSIISNNTSFCLFKLIETSCKSTKVFVIDNKALLHADGLFGEIFPLLALFFSFVTFLLGGTYIVILDLSRD